MSDDDVTYTVRLYRVEYVYTTVDVTVPRATTHPDTVAFKALDSMPEEGPDWGVCSLGYEQPDIRRADGTLETFPDREPPF